MDTMHAFLAIAKLTAEVTAHYWLVSVVLAVCAVTALVVGRPLHVQSFRRLASVIRVAYAIPVVIVLLGALLRYEHVSQYMYREPPISYGIALYAPVTAYLLVVLACAVLLRGWRLRSTALLGPGLWVSLCATLAAGLAIAGVGP
jgi:hypothetical protein